MRLLPNWFILKLSTFSFPAPFMHADSIHCRKMWRKLGLVSIISFNNRLINFSNLGSVFFVLNGNLAVTLGYYKSSSLLMESRRAVSHPDRRQELGCLEYLHISMNNFG